MTSPSVPNLVRRLMRGFVVVTAVLGVASVVLAIVLVAAGASPMIFRSGSMSPTIPAGSIGFSRSVPASAVRVGDVVTVKVDGARVTHRVISLDRHDDVALLQLKGDANSAADRTIYPVRDVPRTWFSVPYLGSFVHWLGSPVGGLFLAAYLLLAFAVIDRWNRDAGRRSLQSSATTMGAGILRTRALALGTATLTLAGAGFGGWVLPTWAIWTDNVAASGATISTGTWDVAAPTSSVTNVTPVANAAGWYKSNITVTLSATDPAPSSGVAGIHYKLNGGTEQVLSGSTGTVTITTEGTNTLEFWAVDNAGFTESPHNNLSYKLDKTPPPAPAFTSITSDTGSSATDLKTSTISQTLSGTAEANSTVTVIQNGTVLGTATASGTGAFTYGPVTLTAGTNTFTATAKDVADNVSPVSAGYVVVLDTVAPNSVVISPNDSTWHNSGAWTVTASDALTGVASISTRLGAGAYTTVSASNGVPISPATLPDGTNTVQAYATDVAGVSSSASPATATIKVDTVKPTAVLNLTGTAGNTPWRLTGAANVVGSDATSGVEHVEYQVDSGAFTSLASGAGFTIPDGAHTITYRAVDFAGNVGVNASQSVSIDSTAPTTTVAVTPTPNSAGWDKASATVTLTPTDPTPGSGLASVKYRTTLNGGAPSGYTTLVGPTYVVPAITAQGTTVVEYQSTDVAGNVETLKSISVKVDTVLPTAALALTGPAGTSPWRLAGTATITGTDATSGVDHVEYQLDGAGSFLSVASGATFVIPEGTHTLTYRAVDVAGNTGTNVGPVSVSIDSAVPVLSNPLPPSGTTTADWTTSSCVASGSGSSQMCVDADDPTPGSGFSATSVKFTLVRTLGAVTTCWNGSTFVAGSACGTSTMAPFAGSQYISSSLSASNMTNGSYTATFTATDVAGNAATPLTVSFTVVTATLTKPAPALSCNTPSSGTDTVTWGAISGATSYTVTWYDSSNSRKSLTTSSLSAQITPIFGPNGGHPVTVTANGPGGTVSPPGTVTKC
jgi:signal peptidase I